MSAPRMSAKDYRDYLERKHGHKVKIAGKWSGSERRYFYGVLHNRGEYEGETIRITPEDMEKHCYTPDFVTCIPKVCSFIGKHTNAWGTERTVRFDDSAYGANAVKVYHEVKGNYRLQSQDAARLRWCFAAIAHPESIFVWAKETRTPSVFDVEVWFDGGRTRVRERSVISFQFNNNGGIEWQKHERPTAMSRRQSRHSAKR